ncbi:hypothetical protein OG393_34790 (plasmid) [Streptomyces sp. NBC_01216]|nr:hypothetical protein OG393_34790 [Streptomyces sp. NBC_01216]
MDLTKAIAAAMLVAISLVVGAASVQHQLVRGHATVSVANGTADDNTPWT